MKGVMAVTLGALAVVLAAASAGGQPTRAEPVLATCTAANPNARFGDWTCDRAAQKKDPVRMVITGNPAGNCTGISPQGVIFDDLENNTLVQDVVLDADCDALKTAEGLGMKKGDAFFMDYRFGNVSLEGGPGDTALCNGVDDNGNGLIDEGCPVGGIAEPVTLSGGSPASPSGDSGPSAGAVGAIAGGAAAATVLAVAAAGWYARRRWVR
ncbi:MAG TPA: hypothetical protein VFT91_08250 [Dehalococcoidia bacterium]|nr:hypothetical protein [Dehalococcoidia bacterium]